MAKGQGKKAKTKTPFEKFERLAQALVKTPSNKPKQKDEGRRDSE